jgi:hypothetical protein
MVPPGNWSFTDGGVRTTKPKSLNDVSYWATAQARSRPPLVGTGVAKAGVGRSGLWEHAALESRRPGDGPRRACRRMRGCSGRRVGAEMPTQIRGVACRDRGGWSWRDQRDALAGACNCLAEWFFS